MLRPAIIGKLRRSRPWSLTKRLQASSGSLVCTAIHRVIASLPPWCVPENLALKHTYDYQVVHVDPNQIYRLLRTGEWNRLDPKMRRHRWIRFRRWMRLGGGWKHLERHVSRNIHGRFIAGGDWDLRYKPFTLHPTVTDLFVNGTRPEDTVEYQRKRNWVLAGEFGWTGDCFTIEDIDRYFGKLSDVYNSIRTEGYRTQTELGNDVSDEIRICIDRDGRPCVFGGGTHRLSIAKLLRLPSVPVIIKRVHPLWVNHCQTTFQTSDVREAIAKGVAGLQVEPADEGKA